MGMMITPSIVGTVNAGYEIIAAIPSGEKVNGQPSYYVVGDDHNGNAVTWYLAFQPGEMEWRASYNWGHYFHGDREVDFGTDNRFIDGSIKMPAVERATIDLMRRVGINQDMLDCVKCEL